MIEELEILIDIARKTGNKFTPIIKEEDKDVADQMVIDFQEVCDQSDVVFSVVKEGGSHYVGIEFIDLMKCGGEPDKYCDKCKTVHFSTEGLNSADKTKKKEEFYRSWYDQRRRIRDKSEAAT